MPQITKILYLVTKSEIGGAQHYIFDLAVNLNGRGFEVAVAAGGNENLFVELEKEKIAVYRLKHLVREINPFQDFLAYCEIKKLLKQIKPDVLHLNSSKAGVLGSLAGKAIGVKKIIYTVHGFVFNEPMAIWKKWFYLWAEKFSSQFKDKIICVSEFDRQVGIKKRIAPEKKLITIHNGIAQLSYRKKSEARESLLQNYQLSTIPTEVGIPIPIGINYQLIGTLANLYPTKGLNYLIQAASLIDPGDRILFIVIGDGQQRNFLEAEIKKYRLENRFLLLGQKENGWQYLPAFDLYVSPSVKEGFPYSILEAMQAGLPIIATKVGGVPEMIEANKSGLLVRPGEPKQLAEAITELVENTNWAENLGRQAQVDVTKNFSLEKMVEATEKIYLD